MCHCHDCFIVAAIWSNVAPVDGRERHMSLPYVPELKSFFGPRSLC